MRQFILPIIGILLITSLAGCENCGPSGEPLLYIVLITSTQARPDTIFSPDTRNQLPAQPYLTNGSQLVLPINLTADSTRYVYRLAGQYDTVTVFYQRKTAYRNRKCGYVLDLYEPERGAKVRLSRGQVQGIYYLQNRDGGFPGPAGGQTTSIQLSVRL